MELVFTYYPLSNRFLTQSPDNLKGVGEYGYLRKLYYVLFLYLTLNATS